MRPSVQKQGCHSIVEDVGNDHVKVGEVDFLLDPPVGVNGVVIGATSQQTATVLRRIGGVDTFRRTEADSPGWVATRASGLALFAYMDNEGNLEAVEFGSRPGTADRVLYQGISVFDQPADALIAYLRRATRVLDSDDEPGYLFTAPDLLLAFWRSAIPEDSEDPEGRFFESVLLARPGYYQT